MPLRRRHADVPFVILTLLSQLLIVLPALVSPGEKVLCLGMNDVATQFSHWRAFAAETIRGGRWPLWCPLTFCGQAFAGNFQSAVFYPLNAHYLVFPLHISLNLEFLLHLWLFALGVYALGRRWGVSPAGAFLAAMTAAFGGPHFQVVFVGHLTIVTTLAWTPLIVLALHEIALAPRAADGWGWSLAGAAALAMQVLAGHPQIVYYTLLTGALYFLTARFVTFGRETPRSTSAATALAQAAVMTAAGFALSAIQMAAGLAALGDIVRAEGYSLQAARTFTPQPETLLTVLFPDIVGNELQVIYWGRHRFLNFFLGVIPLVMALVGWARAERAPRRTSLILTAALTLIMIAGFTPLFPALYYGLPGYRLFRGYARWAMFWSVFVALAAGLGWDALRAVLCGGREAESGGRSQSPGSRFPAVLLGGLTILGGALALAALILHILSRPGSTLLGAWERWFADFHSDPSRFVPTALHALTADSAADAWRMAVRSIGRTGLTLLVAGGLPLLGRRLPLDARRRVMAALLALGVTEGALYAWRYVDFTPLDEFHLPRDVRQAVLAEVKPPNRCILFAVGFENLLMPLGVSSPWGYDQFVPRRMAAFIHRSQAEFQAPTYAGQRALTLSDYHPRMSLIRVSHILQVYTIPPQPGELVYRGDLLHLYRAPLPPLPEAFLVRRWRSASDLQAAVEAVFAPDFDPAAEAVLEGEPTFPPGTMLDGWNRELAVLENDSAGFDPHTRTAPEAQPETTAGESQSGPPAFARVLHRDVNFLDVEAWTPRQAVLVITDGLMNGWQVQSLPTHGQGPEAGPERRRNGDAYRLLAADGALMGVGLGPGLHRLRLSYRPAILTWALWLNIAAVAIWAACAAVLAIHHRRKKSSARLPAAIAGASVLPPQSLP
ncbi:MAG: hypothetical protein Kow0059_20040 [Candidatus Sumerlaeia bacterium]